MSVMDFAREPFGSGCWHGRREQPRRQFVLRNNGWIDIEMVKTLSRPLAQQQNPNRVGPIRKPGLDLLEKDEVKTKRPSMWNIVLYNDDYTPMDFVEFVLKTVFHISTLDALALTLAVHTKGKGIAGTYTFEVAEEKQSEVLLMAKIEEHPLRVEVERA
jgi:ATP-dependent Clp protease adaptor protein ClpS